MDRGNHYEAAFEAYLHEHGLSYIAVDETRRSPLGDRPAKSLDFIVHGDTSHLLVDIKGRRFPGKAKDKPRYVWECWSTEEDVKDLERWTSIFGPGYVGLLVFAYELAETVELPDDTDDLFAWRDRRYLFRAVTVSDYRCHMRTRSPRWGTVSLPGAAFRAVVRPLHHFTKAAPVVSEELPF